MRSNFELCAKVYLTSKLSLEAESMSFFMTQFSLEKKKKIIENDRENKRHSVYLGFLIWP